MVYNLQKRFINLARAPFRLLALPYTFCGLKEIELKTVGTILRNGTERNDGLNYGTERFLKLKLATYHC